MHDIMNDYDITEMQLASIKSEAMMIVGCSSDRVIKDYDIKVNDLMMDLIKNRFKKIIY